VSEKKTLGSYEVGYGKPPKNAQFQKGVSGNPEVVLKNLYTSTMN
jgi:hypothetical protein